LKSEKSEKRILEQLLVARIGADIGSPSSQRVLSEREDIYYLLFCLK